MLTANANTWCDLCHCRSTVTKTMRLRLLTPAPVTWPTDAAPSWATHTWTDTHTLPHSPYAHTHKHTHTHTHTLWGPCITLPRIQLAVKQCEFWKEVHGGLLRMFQRSLKKKEVLESLRWFERSLRRLQRSLRTIYGSLRRFQDSLRWF